MQCNENSSIKAKDEDEDEVVVDADADAEAEARRFSEKFAKVFLALFAFALQHKTKLIE